MRGIQRAGRGTGARRLLSAVLVAIGGFTAFSVHAAPAQRIIVAPVADHANPGLVVDERALSMVATAHGVELTRLRTLATGAGLYRVDGPRLDAAALDALAAAAAAVPGIDYAEVDRLLKPMFVPNDTHYGVQWHYHEATGGLNLEPAWDVTDGSGAVVAVLDTGYRPHVDLAANIVGGYDMISDSFVGNDGNGRDSDAQDPGDWTNAGECGGGQPTQNQNSSWHGTHVAGIIAAVTNNGSGVAGVAYGAKVVPVRVLGKCGGYTSDIADGIIWAAGGSVSGVPANANPADVLNLSLGGGGACGSTTQSAIDTARSLGASVIVAAGNETQNASNSNPAICNGVVTIAATDRSGNRAYSSNYGSVVDVAAPGGEFNVTAADGVASTLNAGTQGPGADNYVYYQGTSMATPHVAGVAALMVAVNPSITPDEVESALVSSARAFPGSCSQCGSGIVDANAAVAAASGGGGGGGPTQLQNGVAETGLSGAAGSEAFFTLEVPAGESLLEFVMAGGSGDADLYVKYGAAPTTSSYDCRPYLGGNNEDCSFSSPAAGTWHVMIRGYSSYSGVSLTGTHSGGGGTCPAGFTEYSGNLSGTGAQAYEPAGTYYYSGGSGLHHGILSGPASGADFDLEIQKWQGNSWVVKSRSESASSDEEIQYSGTSGYYLWRVYSYSGGGDYSFCLSTP